MKVAIAGVLKLRLIKIAGVLKTQQECLHNSNPIDIMAVKMITLHNNYSRGAKT